MSTDPNELIRLLLAQQQQQQQQGGGAPIQNNNYQPQQVYQQLGGAVPPLNTVQPQQPQQQQGGGTPAPANNNQLQQLYQQFGATAPSGNAGQQQQQQQAHSADALSQLIANCLEGAAGPAGSNSAAGVLNQSNGMNLLRAPSASSNTAQPSNSSLQAPAANTATAPNSSSLQEQQQQLLQTAKLLANINPELAAATMQQALALIPGTAGPPQVQQLPQSETPGELSLQLSTTSSTKPASLPTNIFNNANENGLPKDVPKSNKRSQQDINKFNSLSAPFPTKKPAQSQATLESSVSTGAAEKKGTKSSASISSPDPLSLLTVQTWSIERLESYVRDLEASNQPIPNTVRIVLETARSREEKKQAKRIANRKSASISRARKNQLIDKLTASHAKLRRQVLILSYLPDPVAVINSNGEIKFCSVQMERVLKHKLEDLVGSNIQDVIVPESMRTMRQLIKDLQTAEQQVFAARNGEERRDISSSNTSDGIEGNNFNSSGNSSNDANVSQSSKRSFPLLEVNVDGENQVVTGSNTSDPSVNPSLSKTNDRKHKIRADKFSVAANSFTQKSSSLTSETSPSEDIDEPRTKKAKDFGNETTNSEESYPRGTLKHDDVMGSSVTANNADAKLSSLIHYPDNQKKEISDKKKLAVNEKKHEFLSRPTMMMEKQEDSRSSSSNDSVLREGVNNSSEGSGYRNSNESSDQDSSTSGSFTFNKKGKRHRPLAPACNVRLIVKDLTTVWSEVTASIRYKSANEEDNDLLSIDHNFESSIDAQPVQASTSNKEDKEILLCFRPLVQDEKVGEELCLSIQKSKNANQKNNISDPDTDTPSTENGSDSLERGSMKGQALTSERADGQSPE